jgi:hypothetical protein
MSRADGLCIEGKLGSIEHKLYCTDRDADNSALPGSLIAVAADMAQEFCANLVARPPDNFISALLRLDVTATEQQDKLVRYIEAFGVEPYTAIGNVGDQAIARHGAIAKLHFCGPIERSAARQTALVMR